MKEKEICYNQCLVEKEAAMARAAALPFPANLLAIANAVKTFNKCRKDCDNKK